MARLPEYQQTGRLSPDLPQFNFASIKESIQASQSLISNLDRLSKFANDEAEKDTERQAEKFVIDKPLTLEQVQEAAKSGVTAQDLVAASGGGAIWQQTVANLQAEQLKNQLEVKTKSDLINIKTQVDLLQITNPDEIKAKYEAAISGSGKIIGQLSPKTQLKYEAGMSAIASAFYKDSVETLAVNYKANQEALSLENIQHSVTAYKSMLSSVTDPLMLNEVKQLLSQQLYNQSIEAGAPVALQRQKEFIKEANELQQNFFINKATSTEFGINPKTNTYDISYALKKVQAGDFGEHSQVYQFSIDDKKKISDSVYGLVNTQYLAVNAQRNAEKEQSKIVMMASIAKVNKKQVSGKDADSIMDNALAADVITPSAHEQYYSNKNKGTAPNNSQKIMFELAKRDIVNGRINSDAELQKKYPNLHIEYIPDAMDLITDNDVKEAEKLKNKFSGAEGDPYRQKPETNNNYVDLTTRVERLMRLEEKGEPVYKNKVDATVAAQKERMDSDEIKKAKNRQKVLYDSIKTTYDFNPDNGGLDDFVKTKQKTISKYKETESYKTLVDNVNKYNSYKKTTQMKYQDILKEQ